MCLEIILDAEIKYTLETGKREKRFLRVWIGDTDRSKTNAGMYIFLVEVSIEFNLDMKFKGYIRT